MSEETAGIEDLQQVPPPRLPLGTERVLAERRRRPTHPFTGGVLALGRTRYRPSRDLRLLIRHLDGATRGPSAPRSPSEAEIDHVVSFDEDGAGGATDPGDLALLTHRDHGDKTDGAGDYDLMLDRTAPWRTATGLTIVTRPVDPPEPTPVPPDLVDPDDCPF